MAGTEATGGSGTTLGPVMGRSRIEVLDALRGIAILGIFYMNIPMMASSGWRIMTDIRMIGWTPLDRGAWMAVQVLAEGTMRGVLELLFGAGMMVLARSAMTPDGPVAVADLYLRRNLWLLLFGLIDVFVVLWVGDILHIYALAALFLFPFRTLSVRWLIPLGLAFAAFVAVGGAVEYASRASLIDRVAVADAHRAAGKAATVQDKAARAEWQKVQDRRKITPERRKQIADEDKAHAGGLLPLATLFWGVWIEFILAHMLIPGVAEAFCVMLLGVAAWKLGIIQGARDRRFYLGMMAACYGFGLTARLTGAMEIAAFQSTPKTIWITAEFARIAVSLGHVALVNWMIQGSVGRSLLRPFLAAGRVAFSLYFLTSIIGIWVLFAPWGPGLWMRFAWFDQTLVATAVIALLLVVANLWLRYFVSGPLEWVWRSLSYGRRQPLRRASPVADPIGAPALL